MVRRSVQGLISRGHWRRDGVGGGCAWVAAPDSSGTRRCPAHRRWRAASAPARQAGSRRASEETASSEPADEGDRHVQVGPPGRPGGSVRALPGPRTWRGARRRHGRRNARVPRARPGRGLNGGYRSVIRRGVPGDAEDPAVQPEHEVEDAAAGSGPVKSRTTAATRPGRRSARPPPRTAARLRRRPAGAAEEDARRRRSAGSRAATTSRGRARARGAPGTRRRGARGSRGTGAQRERRVAVGAEWRRRRRRRRARSSAAPRR